MSRPISFESKNVRYEFEWDSVKAASNLRKHDVDFHSASTIFLDALALTDYDAAHSLDEERWITLGYDKDGDVLVVSHTYQAMDIKTIKIRIISARAANKRERQSYAEHRQMHSPWQVQQTSSVYGVTMDTAIQAFDNDDTPGEIDFKRAVVGKFYRPNIELQLPGGPEPAVLAKLIEMATEQKVKLSVLIKEWLEQNNKASESSDA